MDPAMLHDLLNYDPVSGTFTWKPRNRNLTGCEAGGICPTTGYRRIRMGGKMVLAHRIAIAMTQWQWPDDQVDHINGKRADNRLQNLRAVSRGENLLNKSQYRSNKSGVTGVHWHKQHRKWCAVIQRAGKSTTIGVFKNFDDAVSARASAEVELGFHINHGRIANV